MLIFETKQALFCIFLFLQTLGNLVGAGTINLFAQFLTLVCPRLEEGVVKCTRWFIRDLLVTSIAITQLLDQILAVLQVLIPLLLSMLILALNLEFL